MLSNTLKSLVIRLILALNPSSFDYRLELTPTRDTDLCGLSFKFKHWISQTISQVEWLDVRNVLDDGTVLLPEVMSLTLICGDGCRLLGLDLSFLFLALLLQLESSPLFNSARTWFFFILAWFCSNRYSLSTPLASVSSRLSLSHCSLDTYRSSSFWSSMNFSILLMTLLYNELFSPSNSFFSIGTLLRTI